MENIFTVECGFIEHMEIMREAKHKRMNFRIIDMTDHDNVFIKNCSKNPIKIDGKVFKFIFMSAKPVTQFHNGFFIIGANKKEDIEDWED